MRIARIMCTFDLRRNICNKDQSDPAARDDNTTALIGRYPEQNPATS